MEGTAKTPEEIDTLVTELKKIDCFHKDVNNGTLETVGDRKKFRITINAQCM
jgi:hypothetical protein